MAKIDPILIKDFSGGWVTEIKSDALKVNQSPDLEQADFSIGGTVKKDTGWSKLGTDSDTTPSTDLFVVPDRQGTEWLLKKCDTKLKIYDSVNNVYSVIKTGLTAGDRLGSQYYDTVIYFLSKVDTHFTVDLTKITRLNGALVGADATITVDSTAAFDASGTVMINGAVVTYTGKTATEFTGCTGSVATPDNYLAVAPTTDLTAVSGIVKGNISAIFAGRLWIASGTTSVIFASKLLEFDNFTVVGSGTGDAIELTIESKVNALKSFYDDQNNLRLMAFAANNVIYAINVDDNEDLSSTIVPKQVFKENVTALNQFSTVVGYNDLYHVDLDNQIKTLGQTYASQGVNKVYSDNISENHSTLFKESYDFSSSRGVMFNNEYWNICTEGDSTVNNRAVIYNIKNKAWRRRTDINANDIKVYNNKIIFSDAATNNVYIMDGSSSIDGYPIRFKYCTLDMDEYPLRFERIRSLRVSGFISENCTTTVNIYRDFGTSLIGSFTLDGSNSDIVGVSMDAEGVFGSVIFGDEVWGGEGSDVNYRFFIAQLELENLPDSENCRAEFINSEKNVYFEITGIKPFIHPQDEHYFDNQYILKNN